MRNASGPIRAKTTGAALVIRLALALLALPVPASAGERYLGIILGSEHFGSDAYNDINPGLTLGSRWPLERGLTEAHAEAGVFYNSYEEVSPIAVVGLSRQVARLGPGAVRIGGSVGLAYYKELSEILEDRHGIPNVGGFIPMGFVSGTYRTDRVEVRLNVLPYMSDDVDSVLNLSLAIPF
ncbi:hypothetical protein [uncultured Jannaschia sp.]|uniref:hypothetical protein n=1 Tax=uncultured Jannaschia sp. TaxID=293347 RepID=UPI002635E374|nr:hypothetical protein [uncultured Jannaschia sp.]